MDRRMFRKTGSGAFAILLCLAAAPSFGQETQLVREAGETVQARLKNQCATLQSTISELRGEKSFALATYESQYFIQCQCLPGELKKTVDSQPKDARVSQDELVAMIRSQSEKCVARGVRETLAQRCDSPDNKEVSAADRGRYCACVNKGVAALSDEELIESTRASARNFDARVKARTDGTAQPAKEREAMEDVTLACKKT